MPYQWVTHTRDFVPNEARTLAAEFRRQAGRARAAADDLRRATAALQSSWEGAAARRFQLDFADEPGAADALARRLEALAAACERISVTQTWTAWEWSSNTRV